MIRTFSILLLMVPVFVEAEHGDGSGFRYYDSGSGTAFGINPNTCQPYPTGAYSKSPPKNYSYKPNSESFRAKSQTPGSRALNISEPKFKVPETPNVASSTRPKSQSPGSSSSNSTGENVTPPHDSPVKSDNLDNETGKSTASEDPKPRDLADNTDPSDGGEEESSNVDDRPEIPKGIEGTPRWITWKSRRSGKEKSQWAEYDPGVQSMIIDINKDGKIDDHDRSKGCLV